MKNQYKIIIFNYSNSETYPEIIITNDNSELVSRDPELVRGLTESVEAAIERAWENGEWWFLKKEYGLKIFSEIESLESLIKEIKEGKQ